jgi:hypothetical protein
MMTYAGIKRALPMILGGNSARYALPCKRLSHSVLSRTETAAVTETMVITKNQFQ